MQRTWLYPSTLPPAVFSELCPRPVSGLASWSKDRMYRLPMICSQWHLIHLRLLTVAGAAQVLVRASPVSRLTRNYIPGTLKRLTLYLM